MNNSLLGSVLLLCKFHSVVAEVIQIGGVDRRRPEAADIKSKIISQHHNHIWGCGFCPDTVQRNNEEWYVAENVCSPSRGALLTGRYAIRSGLWQNKTEFRVIHPNCYGHMLDNEITLPELLQNKAGYATGMIGKWHLGYAYSRPTELPLAKGFEHFLGTPATHAESGGHYPAEPLFNGNNIVGRLTKDVPCNNLTIQYTHFAQEFIRNSTRANKPFFLYAAFDNTHTPVYASPRFQGKSRRGPFGDATMELDWAVGELLNTLREEKVENNTLIWFSSDNGAWVASFVRPKDGASPGMFTGEWPKNPVNAHLNGGRTYIDTGKGSTWEGGHRVPGMAYWPTVIKPGQLVEDVVSSLDIYPTVAHLAGVPMPSGRKYDGTNISPLLKTGEQNPAPHDFFYYYATLPTYPHSRINAVRYKQYKVHFQTRSGFLKEPMVIHNPPLVFDVENDPFERETIKPPPGVIEIATEARKKQDESVKATVPQFDLVNYKCMNCHGLPAQDSKCCQEEKGICLPRLRCSA
eukprot:TRINITY_DN14191_c0_g1_i1.p1 TRINITY_DN14191_c0_g1~~TRINITY_DN14191_c0_g1_i1.p1  ORF type:complete len:520 (-),score=35.32 TRINITY_DN14191_c0_g1_i1:66-1625(-)